ncbi:MAG: c-type cytochrome [Gemmataceae bacterium]|nr:c-type cytochrome [Gemmataceae bacterium]
MSKDRYERLIQGLRAGEAAAMADFCAQFGEPLRRQADKRMAAGLGRRFTPDSVAVSVMHTFLGRVRLGQFQLEDSGALWRLLSAITLAKVRERTRFHLRQKRGAGQETDLGEGALALPAGGASPEDAAEFADQYEALLASLDAEERLVVELKLRGTAPTTRWRRGWVSPSARSDAWSSACRRRSRGCSTILPPDPLPAGPLRATTYLSRLPPEQPAVRRSLLLVALAAMSLSPAASDAQKKKQPAKREATGPADLYVLPDFKVELLHTADPVTEGSWINLCKDDKGRLLVSGQNRQPILRFTFDKGKVSGVEKLPLPVSECMGMLHAHGYLFLNAAGKKGFGLYRFKETDGAYDEGTFLKRFEGGGEHGPHGIALGPDGLLYVMNGNHTKVPEGLLPTSPHKNYREDILLPRQWDGGGHAVGILAPGGYVTRLDKDGKNCELVLAGFRNAYDHAFNADGELFTFDSDMEWDWGMSWYRPIRVNHCVSAAEFGWRSGSGKFPESYPDSLPATVDIGIGSPVGVTNGIGAKFPEKYQKAMYVLDWTYGRVIAVHLKPQGASYTATWENLVAPKGIDDPKAPKKPLTVTDAIIGDDGAMYFTTGGRGTQGALYRVTYTGLEPTGKADLHDKEGAKERALRKELEKFHGRKDAKAVATAWPHLKSEDRFIRYAARVALESQPVAEWQEKALKETDPQASLEALLALARCGDAKAQPALLEALARLPMDKLTTAQKAAKLRVLGLSFIRQGRPSAAAARKIVAELDPLFPGPDELLNRELMMVLAYLPAPGIVPKTLKHMAAAKHMDDQNHYVFHLRSVPVGYWTLEERKEYLGYFGKGRKKLPMPAATVKWFTDAGRGYGNGASYDKNLRNFFREAVSLMSPAEQKELAGLIESIDRSAIPDYDIKPRTKVVKQWTMADLEPRLGEVEKGRDFAKGREAYRAGQCIKCHRMGDEGGGVGPDLTAVASRFRPRDLLESILEPSKVISDQFQNETVVTKRGVTHTGRVVEDTAEAITIQPDPLSPARVVVKKAQIEKREPSKLSPMPAGLADVLTAEEVLDLIAYMEAGGNKGHRAFRK